MGKLLSEKAEKCLLFLLFLEAAKNFLHFVGKQKEYAAHTAKQTLSDLEGE